MNLQQHPKFDWAQVLFAAEAAKEPFEEITMITAKNAFVQLAYDAAADVVHRGGDQLNVQSVNALAVALINAQKIEVQESVNIAESGITVCLDVESVDDDAAVWRGMDLVAKALDQLSGTEGTIYFGKPLRYSVAQVPSILTNVVESSVPA